MGKKLAIKTIVAIGIGAAVFMILGRFGSIPTGIPNTNLETSYAFLALMSVIFGPVAGAAIGFIGHTLKDLMMWGSPWFSWIIASSVTGLIIGFAKRRIDIAQGDFGKKKIIIFNIYQVIANCIGWFLVAPTLDIVIYHEPLDKLYLQGAVAGIANTVIVGVLGTLLLYTYAKTRVKKGTLVKETEEETIKTYEPIISKRENTNKKAVIEFKDYTFKYTAQSEPTLKNIDLTIYEGEKVLIVGPSGSGKSTLSNAINGLVPFLYEGEISGSLKVNGKETKDMSIAELSNNVGTVLQDPDGQFIGLTVAEDIAFKLENDCVAQSDMKNIVKVAAKTVNIDGELKSSPQSLSGGQKQRVTLGGVMVGDGDILLFDEPLASLDPATGKSAIELIDKIQKKDNKTVVIIEHRLEDVLYRNVDRIIVVDNGNIVADVSTEELLSSNILNEVGIREPLYITALKYAGINITEDMKLQSLKTLDIDNCKEKLKAWCEERFEEVKENVEDTVLEVKDVRFGYDNEREILKGISFKVNKGEMVSIVGKNGAGKSTISKLISGFYKPNSGEILLNGRNLENDTIKERSEKIGVVMQNPNAMISKSMIFDEVALGLRIRGVSEEEVKERVYETLKVCGLYEFRNWPISALSFGQKKRVTIASILVLNPEIIILDEPTAGQDFRHYSEIMEFLKEINEKGITIIMITHDMHLMLEYTNRAIVLSNGLKIAEDSAANVLTDEKVIEEANLKETSLYELAVKANLDNPREFVKKFINYDRRVRGI